MVLLFEETTRFPTFDSVTSSLTLAQALDATKAKLDAEHGEEASLELLASASACAADGRSATLEQLAAQQEVRLFHILIDVNLGV